MHPFFRMDARALPARRSALGITGRVLGQYVEALLHFWLDTFVEKKGVVWPDRHHRGTNKVNPLKQAVRDMNPSTPAEQRARFLQRYHSVLYLLLGTASSNASGTSVGTTPRSSTSATR